MAEFTDKDLELLAKRWKSGKNLDFQDFSDAKARAVHTHMIRMLPEIFSGLALRQVSCVKFYQEMATYIRMIDHLEANRDWGVDWTCMGEQSKAVQDHFKTIGLGGPRPTNNVRDLKQARLAAGMALLGRAHLRLVS